MDCRQNQRHLGDFDVKERGKGSGEGEWEIWNVECGMWDVGCGNGRGRYRRRRPFGPPSFVLNTVIC